MKKINLKSVLVGSDFEMFVTSNQGKFVSAIPFIEGTKDEPLAVGDKKGCAIQHDGVLFEANVPPVPLDGKEEMWENIQFVISEGKNRLPENLGIVCCTNGTFDDTELLDPEARIAGCNASFCAWTDGDLAPKPDFGITNDRCAGFHLHFSYKNLDYKEGLRLMRVMDVYLALPLLFADDDRKRRLLYGRAGDFRFKDFGDVAGMEYRVLSNVVIKDKNVFNFVWDNIQLAFAEFNKGTDYLEYGQDIQKAINEYNLDIADELCKEFKVPRLEEIMANV